MPEFSSEIARDLAADSCCAPSREKRGAVRSANRGAARPGCVDLEDRCLLGCARRLAAVAKKRLAR